VSSCCISLFIEECWTLFLGLQERESDILCARRFQKCSSLITGVCNAHTVPGPRDVYRSSANRFGMWEIQQERLQGLESRRPLRRACMDDVLQRPQGGWLRDWCSHQDRCGCFFFFFLCSKSTILCNMCHDLVSQVAISVCTICPTINVTYCTL
jgi:hypothetical protein